MDIEHEIRELKRRVGDLEGTVNVLMGQVTRLYPELNTLALQTTARFDKTDDALGKVVSRLERLDTHVWSLRDDLPDLIREALHGTPPGRQRS